MDESFLELAPEDRKEILQTLSVKLGQAPAVLEKDVWVCWALQQLFAMPGGIPMAFKGGTSLSKVFNAIQRFSEDIDITLDYRALDSGASPFKEGISNSQLSKLTKALREAVRKYTYSVVAPHFQKMIAQQFGDAAYRMELSENGEQLHIYYRPLFSSTNILDHIFIEFGGRNAIEPSDKHIVRPYIAPELPSLRFPEASVQVLSGARTFWEKATLIHVVCNKASPDNLDRWSRHWSDLAVLADHQIGKDAIADRELLADVVKHKSAFYRTGDVSYGPCCKGGLQLVPGTEVLSLLEADFRTMLADGMFYGEQPVFREIIVRLTMLQKEINKTFA